MADRQTEPLLKSHFLRNHTKNNPLFLWSCAQRVLPGCCTLLQFLPQLCCRLAVKLAG